jgi:signal transduction histidine kinase
MEGITNQLLVTLGGNVISILMIAAGGLFVLFQNVRNRTNQLFFFFMMANFAYEVFFIIAALQTNYEAAYSWWFLNIFDVFITMFATHFILHIAKLEEEWKWFIRVTYAIGMAILVGAVLYPHAFLPTVVPKMYFPFYLEAGPLYSVMLVYFLTLPLVAFFVLVWQYFHSSGIEAKRFEYIILMLLIGYGIGCLNFLLVYNIPADPIFGMFFGFYLIPIIYGIFSTNLMDIRVVVKRALYYAILMGAVTAFLVLIILLNDTLVRSVPWLQFWTIPLAVAIISVVLGRMVWSQTKETDRLKYEFITIAAHKLRTPLTRIRWAIPDLLTRAAGDPVLKEGLVRIDVANNRLIELTNVLMEAARTEDTQYWYKKDPVDIGAAAKNALGRFDAQIAEKKLTIHIDIEPGVKPVPGDSGRLASVIDVLAENAVIYTPAGGMITMTVAPEGKNVRFAITDTGIGIKHEDLERIFSSFFRTDAAKTTDTEGVGVGLTVAKSIIEKHNGRMGVYSDGEGKGSTFWFTLPT